MSFLLPRPAEPVRTDCGDEPRTPLYLAVNHWYSTYMVTYSQKPSTVNSRSLLLPYMLTLVAAMLIIHIVIALTGGSITLLAGAMTAVAALGIAAWLWRNHRALRHVRFGMVIAHVTAFIIVTVSYNLHALIRVFVLGFGDAPPTGAAGQILSSSWFGATLVMSSLWGLGLLIHLLGAILGRGWED